MKSAFRTAAIFTLGLALAQPPLHADGTSILVVPGPGLSGNTAAIAALNRAAYTWSSLFGDPVTITVNFDLGVTAPGTLASTNSVLLAASYNTIRNAVVADAGGEADDAVVGFLPTAAQFSGLLPAGHSFDGNLVATKANLKALGFTGLDITFGASDGAILLSSAAPFDLDDSDGVTAGFYDLETLALREIGKTLGFISAVDAVDAGDVTISPSTMDLFRFGGGANPTDPASFTTSARNLLPGGTPFFDDLAHEYLLSTGATSGDGNSAALWKSSTITGTRIGVMDPSLPTGFAYAPSAADVRVLDLIGYQATSPIPEPSTTALMLGALGGALAAWRRRRTRA